jgi:hypothetical protein
VAASVLKTEINGRGDPLRWPHDTLYPQKLALASLTSGGRSVVQATEFSFIPVCSDIDVHCVPVSVADEAVWPSEIMVQVYKSTWCHVPEDVIGFVYVMVEDMCVVAGSVLKLQFGAAQDSYISSFIK